MRQKNGQNIKNAKQYNRGLILQLIATQICNTRIELSKRTGLSKMTVTNIISEFMEKGLVEECEEELTEVRGKNPVILRISEKAPKVAGLLIFRDKIEIALSTLDLKIELRERITFDSLTEEQLIEYSCELIDCVLEKEKDIFGIGVSVIGPVDIWKGKILNPPRFYGIHNVNIIDILKERYDYPFFIEHDITGAALAELLYGMGRGTQDFIFLGISNGIGSGIVSGGEIYHNAIGVEPEIGHISIDRHGEKCACGSRGCLELYATTPVILAELEAKTGKKASLQEFFQMKDDERVKEVFEQMIQDISVGLISSVNILHPELIILGLDCMKWDETYIRMLEQEINDKKVDRGQSVIRIKKAKYGKDTQLIGAIAVVMDHLFKGELLVNLHK